MKFIGSGRLSSDLRGKKHRAFVSGALSSRLLQSRHFHQIYLAEHFQVMHPSPENDTDPSLINTSYFMKKRAKIVESSNNWLSGVDGMPRCR